MAHLGVAHPRHPQSSSFCGGRERQRLEPAWAWHDPGMQLRSCVLPFPHSHVPLWCLVLGLRDLTPPRMPLQQPIAASEQQQRRHLVGRRTLQHFAAPGSALPPGAVAQCFGCNLLVVSNQSAPHAGGVTVLADMATFAYTAHAYTPAGCMCIHDQRPYLFHLNTCTVICHSCR